jgi:hypothetical protein
MPFSVVTKTMQVASILLKITGLHFVPAFMVEKQNVSYIRHMRAVQKVSSHFEYLENRSCGLDVSWKPVREDLTVHP